MRLHLRSTRTAVAAKRGGPLKGTDPVRLRAWVGCTACYVEGQLTGGWVGAEHACDVVGMGLAYPKTHPSSGRTYSLCRVCGQDRWWVYDWTFDDTSCADLLPGECTPQEAQHFVALVRRGPTGGGTGRRSRSTRDGLWIGCALLARTAAAWVAAARLSRQQLPFPD